MEKWKQMWTQNYVVNVDLLIDPSQKLPGFDARERYGRFEPYQVRLREM